MAMICRDCDYIGGNNVSVCPKCGGEVQMSLLADLQPTADSCPTAERRARLAAGQLVTGQFNPHAVEAGVPERLLKKSRLGIAVVFLGALVTICSLLFVSAVEMLDVSPEDEHLVGRLFLIGVGVAILGTVLELLGKLLCLGIAEQIKGAGTIYLAVFCNLAAFCVYLASLSQTYPGVGLLRGLLNALGFLFFLIFLKNVIVYARDYSLAHSCDALVRLTRKCLIFMVGSLAASPFYPPVIVVAMGCCLVLIYAHVRYLILLFQIRISLNRIIAALKQTGSPPHEAAA